jgi:hypothetical protein
MSHAHESNTAFVRAFPLIEHDIMNLLRIFEPIKPQKQGVVLK